MLVNLRGGDIFSLYPNLAGLIGAGAGRGRMGEAGEGAEIGGSTVVCNPAIEIEGYCAVSRDPFAVVLAGDMDVRAGGFTALAGGVSHRVAGLQPGSSRGAAVGPHVQVENDPACALIPIRRLHPGCRDRAPRWLVLSAPPDRKRRRYSFLCLCRILSRREGQNRWRPGDRHSPRRCGVRR